MTSFLRRVLRFTFLIALLGFETACDGDSPSPGSEPTSEKNGSPARAARTTLQFRGRSGVFFGGNSRYSADVESGRVTVARAGAAASPFTFETLAIGRSGAERASRGPIRLTRTGSLELRRGPFVERLQSTQEGVSQSWEIAQLPRGRGDFVARIGVQGQSYVRTTEAGVHFVDEKSGEKTRYGHAIWLAADGRKTPVSGRFESGAIELRVPAEVVESSAYPVVLDPIVGPDFAVDEPIVLDGTTTTNHVSVAGDGSGGSLVVWSSGNDIFGARFDENGSLLDDIPFAICTAPGSQVAPSVAFNGTHYLVAWHDFRNSVSWSIYGARVSPDGTVREPEGILISDAAYTEEFAAVASDGTDFFVVWQDSRNGVSFSIFGTRVLADGSVANPEGLRIHNGNPIDQIRPSITYAGTHYVVAWHQLDDIVVARVTAAGEVLDPTPLSITSTQSTYLTADIGTNGSDALVVWEDTRDGAGALYGARIGSDGTVVDPGGFLISSEPESQSEPSVAFDGSRYLVSWESWKGAIQQQAGVRLESDGTVVDATPIVLSSEARSHHDAELTFDGRNYVLATVSGGAWATHLHPDGSSDSPEGTPISRNFSDQEAPSVASDGLDFLVVWNNHYRYPQATEAEEDLYGALVASDGTVLEVFPLRTTVGLQRNAKVVFVGSHYLVIWGEPGGHIAGARVTPDGQVLDPGGFLLSAEGSGSPSIAFDGTNVLITWTDLQSRIYGKRFAKDGIWLDQYRFTISAGPSSQAMPMLAFGTTDYLAVWRDSREVDGNTGLKIFGARITPEGEVLDPDGFLISHTPGENAQYLGVTFDGANFVILWNSLATGSTSALFGARVDPAGNVLDSGGPPSQPERFSVLSNSPPNRRMPAMAHDGTTSMVVFQEDVAGAESGIFGTRLDGDAATLDSESFAISRPGVLSKEPSVAFNAHGLGLVAYSSEGYAQRIYAALVSPNCSPSAATDETCDGIDDDCDGQVDDDYPRVPTTCGPTDCPGSGELICIAHTIQDTCLPPDPTTCLDDPATGGASGTGGATETGGAGGGDSGTGGTPPSSSGGRMDGSGDGDAETGDGDGESGNGDGDVTGGNASSGTDREGQDESDSGGCGCGCKIGRGPARPAAPWAGLLLVGLFLLRRKAAHRTV